HDRGALGRALGRSRVAPGDARVVGRTVGALWCHRRMPPSGPRLLLRREVLSGDPAPALDAVQQQVVAHRGSPLRVLGAPGTGKTTTLVEAVVDRVERDGLDPGEVLVLAPTRVAAARLRERVTARLSRT